MRTFTKQTKTDNMKNTFKLPEEIGKGINQDHLDKVMNERTPAAITVVLPEDLHNEFSKAACRLSVPKSFIIQELIINFLKHSK